MTRIGSASTDRPFHLATARFCCSKTKECLSVQGRDGWKSSKQIRVIVFIVVHPREVLPLFVVLVSQLIT
jgi:hypothetical protein